MVFFQYLSHLRLNECKPTPLKSLHSIIWRGYANVNANRTPRRAQHSWQAGQVGTHLPIFAKSRIVEISQKCLLGSSLIPLIQFKNWSNALWARYQK